MSTKTQKPPSTSEKGHPIILSTDSHAYTRLSHALDVSTTTLTTTCRLLIRVMFVLSISSLFVLYNVRKGKSFLAINKQNRDIFCKKIQIM
jgi:hypothetical protein